MLTVRQASIANVRIPIQGAAVDESCSSSCTLTHLPITAHLYIFSVTISSVHQKYELSVKDNYDSRPHDGTRKKDADSYQVGVRQQWGQ